MIDDDETNQIKYFAKTPTHTPSMHSHSHSCHGKNRKSTQITIPNTRTAEAHHISIYPPGRSDENEIKYVQRMHYLFYSEFMAERKANVSCVCMCAYKMKTRGKVVAKHKKD